MDYAVWRGRFDKLVSGRSDGFDIAEAALLVATDEYPNLDVDKYLERLERMANDVRDYLPAARDPDKTVGLLNRYLFKELGFAGNRENYYDPRNSYLNDVIDRKLGLPITLAIVYISIGRRLGLPIYGAGLPGHFICKWEDSKTRILIDPFNKGEILDQRGVEARVRDTFHAHAKFQEEWLTTVDGRYILIRLLNNLKGIFVQTKNLTRAWEVVDKLLILDPRSPENIRDMGLLSIHVKAFRKAAVYLEEYLLSHSDAEDAEQLRVYLRSALAMVERLN